MHKLIRTARRASDSKSAEHKKSFSEATWIFCMEPNCFGIIKGEQPLVCNGDDRGQWPKQGGAVGAAACRMRVPRKARSRRREPQPAASRASKVAGAFLVLFWHAKENLTLPQQQFTPRCQRATPLKRKRANVPHGTLALSPHLCAAAVGMRTVYSMYPSRSSRCAVAGTPLSVIRRMAWSMVFTKIRTSFTIEMR